MEIKLTIKQKELIERLGVYMERSGYPPAQGRIIGLLMVSDRTQLTFDEIISTLQLSKSAVSNALNFLLDTGRIEYYTKPGDRKRYFMLKGNHVADEFRKNASRFLEISAFLKEILQSRTKSTTEFNQRLKEAIDFMEFLGEELPAIFKKWEKRK